MLDGTVSAFMGRYMVAAALRAGMSASRVRRLPDACPTALADDLSRVSTPTALLLWEQLAMSDPGCGVGVLAVEHAPAGTFGVWDYLFTHCGSLAEAARLGGQYVGAISDPGAERIEAADDGGLFTIRYATGPAEEDVVAAVEQFALALLLTRSREAAGRRLVPARVAFRHRPPRDLGPLVALAGTRRIDFDAPANALTFLGGDAHAPLPRAEPGLTGVLRRHADMTMAAARPVLDWREKFRMTLRAALRERPLSLETVASRLALSPRTLQRRLAEHGTTWRAEVAAVREQTAMDLLRDTDLPLGAIAGRVGYGDVRALRRAVRRWQDAAPGDITTPC
ncbi:AraC family transcriptional regulator ligand-binding domain-containing protein [Streptomyces sp. NPDC049837]|uniref:AraC family transcriptional regulator ligand-binding domain-containing protein n=1 Tax=Streptomyces sp. NPDC049837 TaxID=3155277 RepID=UPI00341DDCB6